MAVGQTGSTVTGGVMPTRETLGSLLEHPFLARPLWLEPRLVAEPMSQGGRGQQAAAQHSLGLQQLGVGHALQPVGEQLEGTALG